MINDGIVLKDGKYYVKVLIQDGTEDCGSYPSEEEARKAWKHGHKVLNGMKRKKKDAPMYKVEPVVTNQITRIG